jgi:hypothetical protein
VHEIAPCYENKETIRPKYGPDVDGTVVLSWLKHVTMPSWEFFTKSEQNHGPFHELEKGKCHSFVTTLIYEVDAFPYR